MLLTNFNVLQIGKGIATSVCGRLFADIGAHVTCVDPDLNSPFLDYLNNGKFISCDESGIEAELIKSEVIIIEGGPLALSEAELSPFFIRKFNKSATLLIISPFGQTGPYANRSATDLSLFYSSGISRLLTGQVDDLSETPIAPVGIQSAFIAGITAACAGMQSALGNHPGGTIDISIQEALATMAIAELTRAGTNGKSWVRKRLTDGNGATVTILPAKDGYVAVSAREEKQWSSWLKAMNFPEWGDDPRFFKKINRVKNWDVLHKLMSEWSIKHSKQWIADKAQNAHVPSFPLRELTEHLFNAQLNHRKFFKSLLIKEKSILTPTNPFGIKSNLTNFRKQKTLGKLPLSGIRVLDFSWVIAGPTATRYLGAMGAEIIKVEAPGLGDPGRSSEIHTVLGQSKKAIVLNLKTKEGIEIAKLLATKCDILIENFATGVMDRLGLGADSIKELNENLIYISASGMGRTGPDSNAVAYGTLLQSYSGFAGLNRHPELPPRVGLAWLDPMCGLMLAFIAAAALNQRQRHSIVARVDFSMIEAMIWTMAEPLINTQCDNPTKPKGNKSIEYFPHDAWRCIGEDEWICITVKSDIEWQSICNLIPSLKDLSTYNISQRRENSNYINDILKQWAASKSALCAENILLDKKITAAALMHSSDLVENIHLKARNFWHKYKSGFLPGLPWQASFGHILKSAPGLGADTDQVLADVLNLGSDEIYNLRNKGILG